MIINKQLSIVFKYIYTAEIKDGEIKLNSSEDARKYKEALQKELDNLFLAEDGRAEFGNLIEFRIEEK